MSCRFALRALLAASGMVVAVACPRIARACVVCTIDAECPRGFGCTPLGRDVDGGIFSACMAVDCLRDSDCAAGMRCVLGTATECVCPADGPCPNSNCRLVNSCAPVWQAGCNVAADCGEGFQCIQAGMTCGPGGCSVLSRCQSVSEDGTIACGGDSNCPVGWSCLDASQRGGGCINSGGPAIILDPDGGVADPASPVADDASSEAATPAKVCRPPYWGLSNGYAGPGPVSSSPDAGPHSSVNSDAAAALAASEGGPSPTSGPKSGPTGPAAPIEASTSEPGAAADAAGSPGPSGCSVAAVAANRSWKFAWALALGAALLRGRRRKGRTSETLSS